VVINGGIKTGEDLYGKSAFVGRKAKSTGGGAELVVDREKVSK